MKVTALKPGYFGKLREPGDAFDVPDGAKASWFAPASVVQHAPRVNKAPKPPLTSTCKVRTTSPAATWCNESSSVGARPQIYRGLCAPAFLEAE